MSGIQIIVQRDSVCAGDDIDAPHEKRFWLSDDADISEVFKELAAIGYLPSIAGSRESWEAQLNDEVVCRFCKNIENPQFLISPSAKINEYVASSNTVKIKLVYFAAVS